MEVAAGAAPRRGRYLVVLVVALLLKAKFTRLVSGQSERAIGAKGRKVAILSLSCRGDSERNLRFLRPSQHRAKVGREGTGTKEKEREFERERKRDTGLSKNATRARCVLVA